MMNRTILLFVTTSLALCQGCSSLTWPNIGSPFSRSNSQELEDSSFADSKAGRIRDIQQTANGASRLSPAERNLAATRLVAKYQSEDDPVVDLEIVRALPKFQTTAAMEGLKLAAGDSRDSIRLAACKSLGEIRSDEALDVLSNVLATDPNLDVRVVATQAIARFEGNAAIRALQPAINDADPALQYSAILAMKKLHSEDLGNSVAAWQALARSLSPAETEMYIADQSDDLYR